MLCVDYFYNRRIYYGKMPAKTFWTLFSIFMVVILACASFFMYAVHASGRVREIEATGSIMSTEVKNITCPDPWWASTTSPVPTPICFVPVWTVQLDTPIKKGELFIDVAHVKGEEVKQLSDAEAQEKEHQVGGRYTVYVNPDGSGSFSNPDIWYHIILFLCISLLIISIFVVHFKCHSIRLGYDQLV